MTLNKLKINKLTFNKVSAVIIGLVLTLVIQADLVKEDKGKKATFLKALITLPITVNQTKKVQATFSSLNKQGITALNNIVINGTLSYKKAGNYQKVFIQWHSVENNLKKPKAINKAEFSKKFRSELTTDEQQIGTPQEVTVEVDKTSFMAAVNQLNKGLTLAQVEKLTTKTNSNSNTKSNRAGLNTNSGRGSLSSSNGVKSQLPKLGDTADAGGSATEQCEYRYDIENMRAHEQQRTNQVSSTGVVIEQGACSDTTNTFDLVRTYGAPYTPFISTDKVYQSYRITGIIEGEDKIIQSCQADLSNEIAITTTETGCNTSDNINTRVSTVTSRRYYILNGSEVEVQQCLPTDKTFAIQESVCSYGVVSVNGYSIPQTKLYYTNDLGVEVSVRGCQASSTQQFTTHKIDCEGLERYEHDPTSSTSYLMQKTFVVDTISGTEEQINACQRSSSSFAHQAESCPTIHDDDNSQLLRPKRSYFNDTTLTDAQAGSRVYFTACDDGVTDATPYVETTTATATTYTRGDNTAYGYCIIGGNYGSDGSGCLLYGTGSVLFEAYADTPLLLQSASNEVTFASIPSSVLSLVDPTKRLKITAIAGGGGKSGKRSNAGWGQKTIDYYTNPMTTININIGNGSSSCVKGGDTTIGDLVSLTGGRTRCSVHQLTSGHSATSGIPNINAGSPGFRNCQDCWRAGTGGYVKIEVE